MVADERAKWDGPAAPWAIALAGLTTLAVAMGIGRFAFTPILPMLQQDAGLSVAEGGWLASANYLGFLIGAASAVWVRVRPTTAIRAGLVLVGVLTVGMGLEHQLAGWIVLRLLAGVANAWAQVYAFGWCLEQLAIARRPLLNGVVFAGTGTGIMVTGGICLALMHARATSAQAWLGLGMLALLATALIWWPLSAPDATTSFTSQSQAGRAWHRNPEALLLVLSFGISGFGYIIPATFLPVMGRALVPDPLVFGWSWPLFGLAAAVAPLATVSWSRLLGNRRLWMVSHLAMACGVVLPILFPTIGGILVAALLVGATFMINGLASMQEARVVAGIDGPRLMAAMTAAFGAGQIVGPICVSYLVGDANGFDAVLLLAAVLLVASAGALAIPSRRPDARA